MPVAGGALAQVVSNSGVEDVAPAYMDMNRILFSRWVSAATHRNAVYVYDFQTGHQQKSPTNGASSDDTDPFLIADDIIGFSSSRSGTAGYDIFIGNFDSGDVKRLSSASTSKRDLGGSYTRFNVNP